MEEQGEKPLQRQNTQTVSLNPHDHHASRHVHQTFQREVAFDLDRGWWWRLQYFTLFPTLVKLRKLDHGSRLLFPLCYLMTLMWFTYFSGYRTREWPTDSPCQ